MIRKIAIWTSVAVNLVIAAGAIWLASGGWTVIAEDYIVRPMYDRWVSQFEALPVQPGDTVFLGDSITEFANWEDIFPGTRIKNRGIAGDVTAGVLARLDQVTAGKPGQVFLMIGTNDLVSTKTRSSRMSRKSFRGSSVIHLAQRSSSRASFRVRRIIANRLNRLTESCSLRSLARLLGLICIHISSTRTDRLPTTTATMSCIYLVKAIWFGETSSNHT